MPFPISISPFPISYFPFPHFPFLVLPVPDSPVEAIASSDHVFVTLLSRECGNWRSILSVRYYVQGVVTPIGPVLTTATAVKLWSSGQGSFKKTVKRSRQIQAANRSTVKD